jgi:hypothetical protein
VNGVGTRGELERTLAALALAKKIFTRVGNVFQQTLVPGDSVNRHAIELGRKVQIRAGD